MIEIKISDEVMEQYENDYLQLFEQVVLEHAAVSVFQPGSEIPIDYMKQLLPGYSKIFTDIKLRTYYMVGLFYERQGKYFLTDDVMLLESYYRKYIYEQSMYDFFQLQIQNSSEFKSKLDSFLDDIHCLFEEILATCYEPNQLDVRPIDVYYLTHGGDLRDVKQGNFFADVIKEFPNFPVKIHFKDENDPKKSFEIEAPEPEFMIFIFSLVQFLSPWCEEIFYEHTLKMFE